MSPHNTAGEEPRQMPQLHAWVIINPTSGQGKGGVLQHRIENMLRTEFGECVTRVSLASELIPNSNARTKRKDKNTLPFPPNTISTSVSFTEGLNGVGPVADNTTIQQCSLQKGVHVDIVSTEKNVRGREVAHHLTKMVVASRLRRCLNKDAVAETANDVKTTITCQKDQVDALHIFVAVGGDGSLSDVVNGMCRGTLEAFREGMLMHMQSETTCTGELDSMEYYWKSLEDQSILRHFLPPMIYIPAGTGTDFARLGFGCRNAREFVDLLRSVWRHLQSSSSSSNSINVLSSDAPDTYAHEGYNSTTKLPVNGRCKTKELASVGFDVYDVDIGRVSFPRTGQNHFFINECSCGMSCDVIEKCEAYKRSKFMSLLGGKLMFAVASIVSVYQVRPKPFRLVTLPEFVSLPSNSLIPRRIGSDQPHQHLIHDEAAWRGVLHDIQWVKTSAETGIEALPATEPLRFGANYYAYNLQSVNGAMEHTTVAAVDKNSINTFYADANGKAANTSAELAAAVNDTSVPGQWVCFKSSTLAFGNGRWFGGGLQVAPHACATDGQLSVTSWVAGFAQFVSHAPSLYSGNHTHWPSTTLWNTARVIIDMDTHLSTQSATHPSVSRVDALMQNCESDGELLQRLPAVIEMCSVLTMIVPRCQSKRRERNGTHERSAGKKMS